MEPGDQNFLQLTKKVKHRYWVLETYIKNKQKTKTKANAVHTAKFIHYTCNIGDDDYNWIFTGFFSS